LRNSLPSLASGSYDAPQVQGRVMAYRRTLGTETTMVVTNYGRKSANIRMDQLTPGAEFVSVFPKGGKTIAASARGTLNIRLPAQSVRVYALQP
jgi:hypothetical protein